MSEDNVELVRRVYVEWERGNMKAGVELFDPEILFETFMPDAGIAVARGRQEVEAFMRDFLAQWRDYRLIGDEFRASGDDKVFVGGRQAAHGRLSGVEVELPFFSVWTFRERRVVHLWFTPHREQALEAAELTD